MTRARSSTATVQSAPGRWRAEPIDQIADHPLGDIARDFATDLNRGLTSDEAAARLRLAGRNEPAPAAVPSWPRILLRQFAGKLLLLLIVATGVSLALREWLNAAAIGVTVLISGLFGFLNEYRSERAIAALHSLTARRAEVVRDGRHEEVSAAEIVPGDLVVLNEGDVIPADARVTEARGLRVNESILTGEPEAVIKSVEPEEESNATPPGALYAGTTVAAGSGFAVVVATGRTTALGAIAASLQTAERQATTLERRLESLGDRLIYAFLIACALLVALGVWQGREPQVVIAMAVALAIGAVPEGLPAVATATLAIAVRRLAARRVLVRRLDAVETLGSTTAIVTDKTGTLTENRMTVRRLLLPDGRAFTVETQPGADHSLSTSILAEDGEPPSPEEERALRRLLLIASLCNDAVVEWDEEHGWHAHGDPSEAALVLAATGLGMDGERLRRDYPRTATEPFTSATRMMQTTHRTPDGGTLVAIKGAFEQVEALDPAPRRSLERSAGELGRAGYRVFAIAETVDRGPARVLGVAVLEDPLRRDAAEAVEACRRAGIRLILATGDQISTARTVGEATRLLADGGRAVLGAELPRPVPADVAVVARASPGQKEALIADLRAQGEVVAMTGDGVNDASALRRADVGVAVGPNATDVAVEAADVVLTDGRLLSLVRGIREGRQVARSLRDAIMYLLTASFSVILLFALSMALARPLALSPIQILWLNLVVHIFPALALATSREPDADGDGPTTDLLPNDTWYEILWRSLTVALTGIGAMLLAERLDQPLEDVQMIVFVTLAVALVGQVFLVGVRSIREQPARLARPALWVAAAISAGLVMLGLYLPGLRDAIGLASLPVSDLLLAGGCVFVGWNVNQIGVAILGRVTSARP